MGLYINTHTMQYPLFDGDVKVDNAFWEEGYPLPEFWESVIPVDKPTYADDEVCEQTMPEVVSGQWVMRWIIRPKTEQELNFAIPTPQYDQNGNLIN